MKSWRLVLSGLVAGCAIMASGSALAGNPVEYRLVKALYPILVDGTEYRSEDLPVLNYEGSTYIPLRAVGEMLGAGVKWNEAKNRVEIDKTSLAGTYNNSAFRNVAVRGGDGVYEVTGEVRVFEAVFHYAVSDGHDEIIGPEALQASAGAPAWAPFMLKVEVPQSLWPQNGTLMLDLFEESAKDGSRIHELAVPLQQFR